MFCAVVLWIFKQGDQEGPCCQLSLGVSDGETTSLNLEGLYVWVAIKHPAF